MKVVVVCSRDLIWALPAWEQAIPALKNAGHEVTGFIEITGKPATQRSHSVLRSFGLLNFAALGAFATIVLLRRLLAGAPLSFRTLCARHAVPFHQAENPNRGEAPAALAEFAPDVIIAMTDFILKPDVLSISPRGIVNKHAALLPAHKGLLPYFWAVIDRSPQGVSYHLMDERIDEGEVIEQYRIEGEATTSLISFYRTVFADYAAAICRCLDRLERRDFSGPGPYPSSYHGFPGRSDFTRFREAGGRIIRAKDLIGSIAQRFP